MPKRNEGPGFAPIIILVLVVILGFIVSSIVVSQKSIKTVDGTPTPPTSSTTPQPIKTNVATIKPKATASPTATPVKTASTTTSTSTPTSIPFTQPIKTVTPTPTANVNTSGTITVSTTSVNVTLSRANAQYNMVYGSGFTITSQGATGWQIHYNEGTTGRGFDLSSGGITPGGSSTIRSYINSNYWANGTYTGSAIVQYYKNGSWQDGPTITYSITLTD